jgi:phage gp45-like
VIKLVKIIASLADTNLFQKAKATFFGKTQQITLLNLYGIAFNPPDGSFGVGFSPNGDDSNIVVIADHPQKRFTGLAKGELKVGNYLTGAFVHFKADGSILINGNVTVEGTVTATDFVTSVAVYNTHIHQGDSGGVTGVPQ